MEKPEFNWRKGQTAIIRPEWDGAGRELKVTGPAYFHAQWWVPVIDPTEEDPTWNKEAGLMLKRRSRRMATDKDTARKLRMIAKEMERLAAFKTALTRHIGGDDATVRRLSVLRSRPTAPRG